MPIVNFLSGLHQLTLRGEADFASQMLQRAGAPSHEANAIVSRAERLSSRLLDASRQADIHHVTFPTDPWFLKSSRDDWSPKDPSFLAEQAAQLAHLGVSVETTRILGRFCRDINRIKYEGFNEYPLHFVAGDYVTGFLEDGTPRTTYHEGNLFISGVLRLSEYVFLSRAFALPVPSLRMATGDGDDDDHKLQGLDLHVIARFVSLISVLDGGKNGGPYRLRLPTLSELSACYSLLRLIDVGYFLDENFNDEGRANLLDGRDWLKPGYFANAIVDYRSPPTQDLKEIAQAAALGNRVAVSKVRERPMPAEDGTPLLAVSDQPRLYRYRSGNVPKGMETPCLYSPRTDATECWRHDAKFNVRLVSSFPDAGSPPLAPRRKWRDVHQDLNRRLVECLDLPRALERLIPLMEADKRLDMRIRYLGDLVQKTPEDLLRYRGLGPKGLEDVKRFLESKGLRLRMPVMGWKPPPDSPVIMN